MSERKIAKFLRKLFGILENQKYEEVISWDLRGESILIKDQSRMETEIIPVFFSLRKFSSFVRQLHLYNFHKEKCKNYNLVFSNPKFQRENRELAQEIVRKRKTKAQILSCTQTKSDQKSIGCESLSQQLEVSIQSKGKQGPNTCSIPSLQAIVLKSYSKLEDVQLDPYDIFNFLEAL